MKLNATTFAFLMFLLLIPQSPSFGKDESSDTSKKSTSIEQEGTDLVDSSEWREWCEQLEVARNKFCKFHLPNSLRIEGLKCQTRCTIRWNQQCIGQTTLLEKSENARFNGHMLLLTQSSSFSTPNFPPGVDLETVDIVATFQVSNGILKYKIDKLFAGKPRYNFAPEIRERKIPHSSGTILQHNGRCFALPTEVLICSAPKTVRDINPTTTIEQLRSNSELASCFDYISIDTL